MGSGRGREDELNEAKSGRQEQPPRPKPQTLGSSISPRRAHLIDHANRREEETADD
jgi:hypothetical protein